MARLIDADAVDIEYRGGFHDDYVVNYNSFINAPTIDAVSVVHGEWVEHKERTIVMDNNFVDFIPTEYECSNCGLREAHYFINSKPHNYCPNCGADMRGADHDG